MNYLNVQSKKASVKAIWIRIYPDGTMVKGNARVIEKNKLTVMEAMEILGMTRIEVMEARDKARSLNAARPFEDE